MDQTQVLSKILTTLWPPSVAAGQGGPGGSGSGTGKSDGGLLACCEDCESRSENDYICCEHGHWVIDIDGCRRKCTEAVYLHTGEISLDVRYYGNWCPQHSYCADMGGCTSVRYTVDWGPLSTSHSGPHGEVLGSYPVTPGNGSQSPDPNICGHLSYPGIGEIVQETDGAGNYWWQFSVSFSYGLVNWGRIYKKDCGTDKYACAYGVYTGEGEDVTYHASCPNCSPGVGSPHQISVSKA